MSLTAATNHNYIVISGLSFLIDHIIWQGYKVRLTKWWIMNLLSLYYQCYCRHNQTTNLTFFLKWIAKVISGLSHLRKSAKIQNGPGQFKINPFIFSCWQSTEMTSSSGGSWCPDYVQLSLISIKWLRRQKLCSEILSTQISRSSSSCKRTKKAVCATWQKFSSSTLLSNIIDMANAYYRVNWNLSK